MIEAAVVLSTAPSAGEVTAGEIHIEIHPLRARRSEYRPLQSVAGARRYRPKVASAIPPVPEGSNDPVGTV